MIVCTPMDRNSPDATIGGAERDPAPARLHPRDRRRRRQGGQERRPGRHALSTRAERLPAHRPRQVDLPELRRRGRVRRHLQPALRRHQPDQGGRRVRRRDRGGRALARVRRGTGEPRYASDYFEQLYEYAVHLIQHGQGLRRQPDARTRSAQHRGTLTEPGTDSPYRDRTVEENLDLFARMRAGEFEDGAHVLRAKIDMASPNINMRDPVLYRIRRAHHHRTGDAWCIYPMYDFAHPPSDALERITHSLCTLEFEDHRPLYDWLIDHLPVPATAAADRVRAAEPDLHGHEQAQAARARAGRPRRGLGRSAHADDRRACAGAATRRRRSARSAIASASPSARTSSTSRCSSTRCART